MVSLPLPLLLLLLLLALGRPVVPSGPATSAGSSPPPTAGSVSAATPVLVAATQTSILWYPLNSATLHGADGASAILMRAQSCPDVNTNTTDSAFVSYSNGSAWSELGSQPVQERLCYPYPLSSRSSVMCLPSVDAGHVPGVALAAARREPCQGPQPHGAKTAAKCRIAPCLTTSPCTPASRDAQPAAWLAMAVHRRCRPP